MAFTWFVRRLHLYLALFVAPWMLLYGLSVLCMNHMPFIQSLYGERWAQFSVESRTTYDAPLPADPSAASRQILRDLDMDGAHSTQGKPAGPKFVITRNDATTPRRITFTPADKTLIIERMEFQLPLFLRRMHTRRGYTQDYLADDLWAFCVDLAIASILLWGLTGLWMWYKMRKTRWWGTVWAAAGCVLFVFFLLVI